VGQQGQLALGGDVGPGGVVEVVGIRVEGVSLDWDRPSVEHFPSFSLSYAYKFNPKLTLGARAQLGFGARLLLTNPSVDYKGDQYDGIHTTNQEVRAFTNGLFTDMLKFQCFYRYSNVKHLYIDVGPYVSFGMINEMEGGKSAGMEASVFYTRKHFHIGTRILAGWQTFDFSDDIVFALFSIPIFIGINF